MNYLYSLIGWETPAEVPAKVVEEPVKKSDIPQFPSIIIDQIRAGVTLRKTRKTPFNAPYIDTQMRLMQELRQPREILKPAVDRPYAPIHGSILDRCVAQLQEKIRSNTIFLAKVAKHAIYMNEHDQLLSELRKRPALRHIELQPAAFMSELQKKLQIRRVALNWV